MKGNQPEGGTMTVTTSNSDIPGYPGSGSIIITYSFSSGIQVWQMLAITACTVVMHYFNYENGKTPSVERRCKNFEAWWSVKALGLETRQELVWMGAKVSVCGNKLCSPGSKNVFYRIQKHWIFPKSYFCRGNIVARLGKHGKFPEIAQLLQSIEIFSVGTIYVIFMLTSKTRKWIRQSTLTICFMNINDSW